jgi:hypothetical protein
MKWIFLYFGMFLIYTAALTKFSFYIVRPALTSLISKFILQEPFHSTTGAGIGFIIGVELISIPILYGVLL